MSSLHSFSTLQPIKVLVVFSRALGWYEHKGSILPSTGMPSASLTASLPSGWCVIWSKQDAHCSKQSMSAASNLKSPDIPLLINETTARGTLYVKHAMQPASMVATPASVHTAFSQALRETPSSLGRITNSANAGTTMSRTWLSRPKPSRHALKCLSALAAASGAVSKAPVSDAMPSAWAIAVRPVSTRAKLARASQLLRRTSQSWLSLTSLVRGAGAPWQIASVFCSCVLSMLLKTRSACARSSSGSSVSSNANTAMSLVIERLP
eukprot:CAMPEP_0202362800 /NCGR_PEP_ID=MMETSP1126-20121109/14845_1 /ASSEMBLY_ACC=CAM_ASM_000457 /TAXON_ID=3047 /ORGANISM="Dunaliella tertiolecta, Strain CCMP1320" /LENGTH=265 /DNA_ID=CAMNT_0048957079 /DNA_START=575 /DNA_END=1372 /DNA_ORIENTATION=-